MVKTTRCKEITNKKLFEILLREIIFKHTILPLLFHSFYSFHLLFYLHPVDALCLLQIHISSCRFWTVASVYIIPAKFNGNRSRFIGQLLATLPLAFDLPFHLKKPGITSRGYKKRPNGLRKTEPASRRNIVPTHFFTN